MGTEWQILAAVIAAAVGFMLYYEFERALARGVSIGRAALEFGAVAVLLGYVLYTVAHS